MNLLDEEEIRERVGAASDPNIPGQIACDVTPRSIRWLWPGYFPRGKLVEIIGDPDQGKSLIIACLSASITAGIPYPDGFSSSVTGNVIIISTEDDKEDTLRPRLEAAGADLTRVRLITAEDHLPTLPKEVEELRRWLLADKALALFLDPFDSFLGDKIDANSNPSIRRVMSPLGRIAHETGAVIASVRHLNKDSKIINTLYRGGGSMGITAAARASFLVASVPTDLDTHIFARNKGNLTKRPPTSLGYKIVEATIGGLRGEPIKTAKIEWTGPVSLAARDLLRDPDGGDVGKPGPKPDKLQAARVLIGELLRDGRKHQSEELIEAAKRQGVSFRTLNDAAKECGVKRRKSGFAGGWLWWLPAQDDPVSSDGDPANNSASSEKINKNQTICEDFNSASSQYDINNSASSRNPNEEGVFDDVANSASSSENAKVRSSEDPNEDADIF